MHQVGHLPRIIVFHVLYSLTMGKVLVYVSDVSRVTPLLKNLYVTEAAKYSEPMRTRTTPYQPTSSVCSRVRTLFYSKSGKWFGTWQPVVTSLFVRFVLSSRTCLSSGCTSGMVRIGAKCRTVPVNRNVCLRTLSTQGHSAAFSSQTVNTFWRRQRCHLTGSVCVQESVV